MNRLGALMREVDNEADVQWLRRAIPELTALPPVVVEDLYSRFSDTYEASWLIVDAATIKEFAAWLRAEV